MMPLIFYFSGTIIVWILFAYLINKHPEAFFEVLKKYPVPVEHWNLMLAIAMLILSLGWPGVLVLLIVNGTKKLFKGDSK